MIVTFTGLSTAFNQGLAATTTHTEREDLVNSIIVTIFPNEINDACFITDLTIC